MSKGANFEITSPDMLRLEKTFQDLAYSEKRSVLISAFRKATKPTVEAIRSNAPRKSGNLKRSIGILTARNEIAVIVAARRNRGFKGAHGHLVEFGTKERSYITKKGNEHRTGRMDYGKSYGGYFKRGIESTQSGVMKTLGDEWYKSIERFHRKNGLR